jgi:hypothetical protein
MRLRRRGFVAEVSLVVESLSLLAAQDLLTTRSRVGSRLPPFAPSSLRPSALPGRKTHPRTKRAIRRGMLEETSMAALSGEFEAEWLPWS